MEPLFFKAENRVCSVSPVACDALQWSRFFSKRKIPPRQGRPLGVHVLQWSRFFSKRKIKPIVDCVPVNPLLQWSRFFSKRKIAHSQAPCFQRPAGCLASGREFIPTKPRSHQPCFCKFKPHKPFSPASSSRPTQHHLATRTDPTQHHCMTMDATQQR